MNASIHSEVLAAARRLCHENGDPIFRVEDVVKALPHLNPSSVRTHVTSRCCINAPKNHPHRWPYFRRVGRGVYEIDEAYRAQQPAAASRIREQAAFYETEARLRDTVHIVAHRSGGFIVGEALEIAVVSQGRSLDELVSNMREAIALHLDAEDPRTLGLVRSPRLSFNFEDPLASDA